MFNTTIICAIFVFTLQRLEMKGLLRSVNETRLVDWEPQLEVFRKGIGMSLYRSHGHWLSYDLLATAVRLQYILSAGIGFSIPLDGLRSGEILRCGHLTVFIRLKRAVITFFEAYVLVDSVLDAMQFVHLDHAIHDDI
jgi:hypothetical protein